MGKMIYSFTTSLDGYVAGPDGSFDWAMPSEEVHLHVNELSRSIGTFLLGRRMYEVLAVWDTLHDTDSPAMNEFADIWTSADKIVYSSQLSDVSTKRTRIERTFDVESVRQMIRESDRDFGIGGPHLAAAAIKAGLVDEYHQYIAPIMVGGGTPWLPPGAHNQLRLTEMRKFDNGFAYLKYGKE